MYKNYRVISVCPAGRRRFLELLNHYILRNRDIIDEHHLWLNTNIPNDRDYINQVADDHDFFKVIKPKMRPNWIYSIHPFFKYCTEPNTIYIRFDDDIVWMADDAVEKLLEFRVDNSGYFLVYPHIINNSMNKNPDSPFRHIKGDWFRDGKHCVEKHNYFLDNIKDLDQFKIADFESTAVLNINCICWFGEEFRQFDGTVDRNEEVWLSKTKPRQIEKVNAICGDSLMAHFSFRTQRQFLDDSDILSRYRELIRPIKLI